MVMMMMMMMMMMMIMMVIMIVMMVMMMSAKGNYHIAIRPRNEMHLRAVLS
jgi:hypothetical protein